MLLQSCMLFSGLERNDLRKFECAWPCEYIQMRGENVGTESRGEEFIFQWFIVLTSPPLTSLRQSGSFHNVRGKVKQRGKLRSRHCLPLGEIRASKKIKQEMLTQEENLIVRPCHKPGSVTPCEPPSFVDQRSHLREFAIMAQNVVNRKKPKIADRS